MKDIIESNNPELINTETGITCGNCWGHQEYKNEYVGKIVDFTRGKKDNFISRFVKKYIRKSK